jgi:hypothetical protein
MNIETKDKILVVQSNIEALRNEINLRIVSQSTLWRVAIAGLAAVTVLKTDIDIGRFLPLAPIVGMLITAHWFSETFFLFRTGRWIAFMESQINNLAGSQLLQYESTMWKQRKATLWGKNWFYLSVSVFATALYVLLLYRLWPVTPYSNAISLVDLFYAAAFLSYLFAAVNFYRIWSLLRQP